MKKASLDILMKKKLTAWLIVAFMIVQHCAIAQKGEYFMTHYQTDKEFFNNANFDILQDNQGIIYIANRSGVLRFDGHNWESITTPAAIFSLTLDSNSNIIYTAGYNGLGKLELNNNDELEYKTLMKDTADIDAVYQLIIHENKLFGLSDEYILSFDLASEKKSKISSDYSGDIIKLFKTSDGVFTNTTNSGLMRVENTKLSESKLLKNEPLFVEFLLDLPQGKGQILGTSTNDLLLKVNDKLNRIDLEDDYIKQSDIIDAVHVEGSIIAIATLKGGVIFVDYAEKKIDQIINYQSGLPDNEIYTISKDSNGGVWVAHSKGFTRISPQLPFRLYSNYEGLEGNVLSVINHQGKLYVGTSVGLFYLKKVNEYEEKQYVQKETITIEQKQEEAAVENNTKKGILGLFKRKRKQKEVASVQPQRTEKVIYRTQTKRELKSTTYQYYKVPQVQSKISLFARNNNDLYAAGTAGLFKITDSVATLIGNEPVKHLAIVNESRLIIAATYDDQIVAYKTSGGHNEIDLFSDYRDNIQHIFEDKEGRLWLTSDDELFYITVEDFEISSSEEYPIKNPFLFNTLGAATDEGTFFINESGELYYNSESNTIENRETNITRYISGDDESVWVFENEQWSKLGAKANEEKNLLNVFENLKYISVDQEKHYWVVTEKNEIVKIGLANKDINEAYDLYLRHIEVGERMVKKAPKLTFEQSNNAITFEFAQPEFSGVLNFTYQYKLSGLSEEWSEWSKDNYKLNFNYLPEGTFELNVRSKDALGNTNEIEPISFKIVPPYWKRPWFYALEFTALALLLFFSVRLKDLGFKYRLASRLLALVTLIIIIEFIQTIAENEFAGQSSPVFDFIVQVSIAIIVLPVESVIRKYIFKEKNVQILDFVQLKNKNTK